MNLIFFGPPGGGKGTQARLLQARRGFVQISTGDILREAIAGGTARGREAQRYMDKGELVPDVVMIGIGEERLRRPDTPAGFVLDGFPRALPQAAGRGGGRGGQVAARALEGVARAVAPGGVTAELDRLAETFIRDHGGVPSFKYYRGYPASICVSIDAEVVHGIPGTRRRRA